MIDFEFSSLFNLTVLGFIIVLLGFIVGFLAWMLKWSKEAKYEKFFLETENIIQEWIPEGSYKKSESILITLTSSKYGSIRRAIRLFTKKVLGLFKKIPTIIFVSDDDSEIDQQIFLIRQAVGRFAGKELLTFDLLSSIIAYYMYKFCLNNQKKIISDVYERITKEYENSKYHEHIQNLDDVDFSMDILKTAFLKERKIGDFTLMKYVVLPMIRERQKELVNVSDRPKIVDKEKKLLSKIIIKLAEKKYIVAFVGIASTGCYYNIVNKYIKSSDILGVILEARGIYLSKLRNISLLCCNNIELKDILEISGIWNSTELDPQRKETIWIILEKKSIVSPEQSKLKTN